MPDAKSPFHRGEKEIQSRLGIQEKMEEKGRRLIRDRIPEKSLEFFARLPLLAIGTVDECGRPWASALAGKPGFARTIDPLKLEVKARPVYGDPLNKALIDGDAPIGLNVLWTDGERLVGSCIGRTLWYLERDDIVACDICGVVHVHHKPSQGYRAVEIASEAITDEGWLHVPDGTVYSVDPDMRLRIEQLQP